MPRMSLNKPTEAPGSMLEEAFELCPVPMLILDPARRVERANREARALGADAGAEVQEVFHPSQRGRAQKLLGSRSGGVLTLRQGRRVRLTLAPLGGGRLLLTLLPEPEELEMYRSFIENSLTGVYILQDNTFRFVNSRMCELTGYRREELIGMDFRKLISPESRDVIKGSELRQMHLAGAELVELRGVRKDGELRDVLVYSVPTTYRGRPAVQGSVIDITELKNAERKLRLLADIAENVSEAICCTDSQGRIIYWNAHAEKLFQYSRDEVLGRHVSLLIPEDRVEELQSCLAEAERRGATSCETDRIARDGRRVIVELNVTPMRDEEGRVKAYIMMMRDITQRKQMERQIIISEKLASLGVLATGIAHELNNPLNNISLLAQLLKEDIRSGRAREEEADMIVQQVERASRIIRGLLELSREGIIHFEPVDVNELVDETLTFLEDTVSRAGVRVVRRLGKVPQVAGDRVMLQQVFANLITNACQSMKPGGRLTIETAYREGRVEVSFTDTGSGIPEEHLSRIFDPFFTTKDGSGTGLGLAVSHTIIKKHEGEILVESEPGRGSTFRVLLPASP